MSEIVPTSETSDDHDRLVHNAHCIEMRGDSMRKNRGKPNPLTKRDSFRGHYGAALALPEQNSFRAIGRDQHIAETGAEVPVCLK